MKINIFNIIIFLFIILIFSSCRKPIDSNQYKVIGSFKVTGDKYNNSLFEIIDTSSSYFEYKNNKIKIELCGFLPNNSNQNFNIYGEFNIDTSKTYTWYKNMPDNKFEIEINESHLHKWLPQSGTIDFTGLSDTSNFITGKFSGFMYDSDDSTKTYRLKEGTYSVYKK